ncbi:MAG: Ig-like domain-containing protein, partial [Lachnospiraceae bacterium]|nr:Ig-like domain-containing protein [Lachnospiraceae bacterium]
MKKFKIIFAVFLSIMLMLTSIVTPSATVFATTITKETKSITLNVKSKQTMYVGTSRKIKVKSVKPTGTSKKVTYKSSNASVVKVTKNGTIKALKEGKATITVTSAMNKTVSKKVTVTVKNLVKNKTYNKMVIALDKKSKKKKLS